MSAAALMDWLGQHMPQVQKEARSFPGYGGFHEYMQELTGVNGCDSHDAMCAAYLAALQAKHPGPRKPTPQIPPPVWDTRKVTADGAWAAVVAMCGGGHG